jgi:hypothetical protein
VVGTKEGIIDDVRRILSLGMMCSSSFDLEMAAARFPLSLTQPPPLSPAFSLSHSHHIPILLVSPSRIGPAAACGRSRAAADLPWTGAQDGTSRTSGKFILGEPRRSGGGRTSWELQETWKGNQKVLHDLAVVLVLAFLGAEEGGGRWSQRKGRSAGG